MDEEDADVFRRSHAAPEDRTSDVVGEGRKLGAILGGEGGLFFIVELLVVGEPVVTKAGLLAA